MTSKWAWAGAAAVAVGIAFLLVDRLDGQSLAFMAGVVCGVAGSAPAAAIYFWYHQRQAPPRAAQAPERPPQVVVMPPVQQQYLGGTTASHMAPPLQRPQREFTIVGEQEGEEDGIT